jgi:hypothetical protein
VKHDVWVKKKGKAVEGSRGVAPFICKWEAVERAGDKSATDDSTREALSFSKMGVRTYPNLKPARLGGMEGSNQGDTARQGRNGASVHLK